MSKNAISKSRLVLIPSYNSGEIVLRTVEEVLSKWLPVWVVVDGSDDGTAEQLQDLAKSRPNLKVLRLARNQGKGAAVLHGVREAVAKGFTHILAFDADGQHPADFIPRYMAISKEHPEDMILGKPVFPENAPWERVWGRKLSNFWASVETLGGGIGDTLFGMRVYPAKPFLEVMESIRWARRYDFDTEIAVRLSWRGVECINVDTPVRYLTAEEGGISHFKYLRDNGLLIWMHFRLLLNFLIRWPLILGRRRRETQEEELADPNSLASHRQRIDAIAGQFVTPWIRGKVRRRLWGDPFFDAVADLLSHQEPPLPLLDVGSGRGLLPFYLRTRGIMIPVRALAKRRRDVGNGNYIASQLFGKDITFVPVKTLPRELSAFRGNVVLTEGLQHLSKEEQRERLVLSAEAVPQGGLLILRELDPHYIAWQDRWKEIGENPKSRFSTTEPADGNEEDYHFPSREEVTAVLAGEGLVELVPKPGHLMVFTRQ